MTCGYQVYAVVYTLTHAELVRTRSTRYPVDLTPSFGAEASASRGSGQVRELRETLNLPQGGAFGLFRHSQAFVGLRTSPLLPHRRSDNEILTA